MTRQKGKYALMCAFATLMSLLTPVRGQTGKQHRDSVSTMREVVVKGTRENTPHQIITRNQINSLPSNSVADALKYLAGVQIKDYGGLGGQKTINVRSLGSQHVGVYMDGVRITNAQNGTVDLGKYSLTTLESVSLYNANKSERLMMATEYASASTVYMRTRRPDSTATGTGDSWMPPSHAHGATIHSNTTRNTRTPQARDGMPTSPCTA